MASEHHTQILPAGPTIEEQIQTLTPVPALEPDCNSVVLEEWFEQTEWSGKLASCLIVSLLNSASERYREIGRNILDRLQKDVVETEGLTSPEDMFIREILFSIAENKSL